MRVNIGGVEIDKYAFVNCRYGLGLAVGSTVPGEIAKGFSHFLLESPQSLCNYVKMKQFAQQNTAEKSKKIIFQYLQNQ